MLNRRQFLGVAAPALLYQGLSRKNIFASDMNGSEIVLTEEALRIHRSALVIDGHNDFFARLREKGVTSFDNYDLLQDQPDLQTDIPRLLKGGVGAQFWVADGSIMNNLASNISSTSYCMGKTGALTTSRRYKLTT